LRRALETFTPSANIGLRVKREMSYEFHPPDASQPNYTAQVTIRSKTFYKPGRYVPDADKDSEKTIAAGPQADESAFAEEMLANRADDPSGLFDADGAFPSKKPMIVESHMPAPRLDKVNVYELTYRAGRWQLETLPESKHEQMWFEYALQQ